MTAGGKRGQQRKLLKAGIGPGAHRQAEKKREKLVESNAFEAVPSIPVLGRNRRDDHGRNHPGRLGRPSLGIGYLGGSIILFALLIATLGFWYWSLGSVSVASITSRKAEILYWATIMFSQTLGTALGDWMADPKAGLGLGYEGGALVFGAGLAVIAGAYFWTNWSRTLLFWAAFILTRPLGATLGDLLDKPLASGGLALSRYSASAVYCFS